MIGRVFKRLARLSLWGAAVGAIAYFFDPRNGRGRRSRAKDQVQAKLRRGADQASRTATHVENKVEGLAHQAASSAEPPDDDKTLVDKVKSEVLGRPEYSGSDVVVDAANGVVTLRGQVESQDLIGRLAADVSAVPGVREVENHLHLPETPAPNKQASVED